MQTTAPTAPIMININAAGSVSPVFGDVAGAGSDSFSGRFVSLNVSSSVFSSS